MNATRRLDQRTHTGEAPPEARVRLFEDGFLYATRGTNSHSSRHSGSLLLALTDTEFEIEVGGQSQRAHAVALRPAVAKRVRAGAAPFACIDASTHHPLYRAFAALGPPGFRVLPAEHFASARPALEAFSRGLMSGRASRLLYRRLADLAAGVLPAPPVLDPRIARVIGLLDDDASLGVAQLAAAVCVSRDRLSHLFTTEMGLPLRKYTQSLKLRAAARLFGKGLSLTQIAAAAGFSDSAHFSKIWSKAYGASPTFFFIGDALAIYPPAPRPDVAALASSRFRSRNAANSHERMPTTKV